MGGWGDGGMGGWGDGGMGASRGGALADRGLRGHSPRLQGGGLGGVGCSIEEEEDEDEWERGFARGIGGSWAPGSLPPATVLGVWAGARGVLLG